ncbi:hypothetical protein HK405_010745 [Cladochytrium tenue]|nr:hypothetical protein HK405_010745 [Cladochytrium tenue]
MPVYDETNEPIHDEIHEALNKLAHVDYTKPIIRNASVPVLYEEALAYEKGTALTSQGALALNSGDKKGRSPRDKRVVDEPSSSENVWVCIYPAPLPPRPAGEKG